MGLTPGSTGSEYYKKPNTSESHAKRGGFSLLSLFATHDFYRVCMAGFPTNIVTAGVSVMRAELDAATSSSVDMQEAQWRAGVNRQAQPEAAAHQQQQAAQVPKVEWHGRCCQMRTRTRWLCFACRCRSSHEEAQGA